MLKRKSSDTITSAVKGEVTAGVVHVWQVWSAPERLPDQSGSSLNRPPLTAPRNQPHNEGRNYVTSSGAQQLAGYVPSSAPPICNLPEVLSCQTCSLYLVSQFVSVTAPEVHNDDELATPVPHIKEKQPSGKQNRTASESLNLGFFPLSFCPSSLFPAVCHTVTYYRRVPATGIPNCPQGRSCLHY